MFAYFYILNFNFVFIYPYGTFTHNSHICMKKWLHSSREHTQAATPAGPPASKFLWNPLFEFDSAGVQQCECAALATSSLASGVTFIPDNSGLCFQFSWLTSHAKPMQHAGLKVEALVLEQEVHTTAAELHGHPMGIWNCLSDNKYDPPTLESPHLISLGFKQLTSFSCHLSLQDSGQEMTTKTSSPLWSNRKPACLLFVQSHLSSKGSSTSPYPSCDSYFWATSGCLKFHKNTEFSKQLFQFGIKQFQARCFLFRKIWLVFEKKHKAKWLRQLHPHPKIARRKKNVTAEVALRLQPAEQDSFSCVQPIFLREVPHSQLY